MSVRSGEIVDLLSRYWRRLLLAMAIVAAIAGTVIAGCGQSASLWDGHPSTVILTRVQLALALACIVLAIAAGIAIYLVVRRKLRRSGGLAAGDRSLPAAQEEARVSASLSQAHARLNAIDGGGAASWFRWRRHKREVLPWYLVIGAPAAGKSTLIRCLSQRVTDNVSNGSMLGHVEPTRYAAWWLTGEAVLIDTPGRYTTHAFELAAQRCGEEDLDQSGDEMRGQVYGLSDGRTDDDKNRERGTEDDPLSPQVSDPTVDPAGWSALLRLLRQDRPGAPVNGVIVAVSVAELFETSSAYGKWTSIAARLAEARARLGHWLPVYIVVTKLDMLAGFGEYFGNLVAAEASRPLGFSLAPPSASQSEGVLPSTWISQCRDELDKLVQRIHADLNARLQQEPELFRRKALFRFPGEFACLAEAVMTMLQDVVTDADEGPRAGVAMLRGLYFTSARQGGCSLVGDRNTVFSRLVCNAECGSHSIQHQVEDSAEGNPQSGPAMARTMAGGAEWLPTVGRVYFLRHLLGTAFVPEAQLAGADPRRARRQTVLRLALHVSVPGLLFWLAWCLATSFERNRDYLTLVTQRTGHLAERLTAMRSTTGQNAPHQLDALSTALAESRDLALPNHGATVMPDVAWQYGLAVVPRASEMVAQRHAALLDRWLTPFVVSQVEAGLTAAMAANDRARGYDALRIYVMFKDATRFKAAEVRRWVLQARDRTPSGNPSFPDDLVALLDHRRPPSAGVELDGSLVRSAREWLAGMGLPERVYALAKVAMADQAPPDFTLVRALGRTAAGGFGRHGGAPLDEGVPGLFTHAGYHAVFAVQLPGFVKQAMDEDRWVIGPSTEQILRGPSGPPGPDRPDWLVTEVRRRYLSEYAAKWDAFLGDLRAANIDGLSSAMETLRGATGPDTGLMTLARSLVHETTLTMPAAEATAARPRDERTLVDSHFAALREWVTGATEPQGQGAVSVPDKAALVLAMDALDGYHARLAAAAQAIGARNLPTSSEAGNRLRAEAARSPPPFKAVLAGYLSQGERDINKGIGEILIAQTEAVIGDQCRSAIEGKYPFNPKALYDVSPEDFARVFAAGGILDDFFTRTLAPHVDTTISPWRYKLTAPDVPPVTGPALAPFQRARQIRDAFFREAGNRGMGWRVDIKVMGLDADIIELNMDFDGQAQRYVHGPVLPLKLTWPGPRGGQGATIAANPEVHPQTSTLTATGPWALMRVIAKGKLVNAFSASHFVAEYDFDGRKARLDVSTAGQPNPWTTGLIQGFRCPGR